ncbi:MAG: hypothetical protein WBQ43_18300 [Terriglobales bacterium]
MTKLQNTNGAAFGSVQNPVSMMEHKHESAGNALRAMPALAKPR